jgi:hypothetical protein
MRIENNTFWNMIKQMKRKDETAIKIYKYGQYKLM